MNDERRTTKVNRDPVIIGRHVRHSTALVDDAGNIPLEHWQAIRQAIGRRLIRYDAHLFTTGRPLGSELLAAEDDLAPAPAEPPTLQIADLAKIRAELLREPMVLALWFVDRPREFMEMSAVWADYHKDLMFYPSLVYFDRATATPDDWKRAPWFAVFPGVWAEMSDGIHKYLLRYNSALEAERSGDWVAPLVEYADAE